MSRIASKNCRGSTSRASSAISSSVPNSRIRSTSACGLLPRSTRPSGRRSRPPLVREGRTSSPLNLPFPSLSSLARAASAFSISSAEISPSSFSSSAMITGNLCSTPPGRRSLPEPRERRSRRLGSSSLRGCANSILPSPHEMPTSRSSSWVMAMVLMVIGCPLACLPN